MNHFNYFAVMCIRNSLQIVPKAWHIFSDLKFWHFIRKSILCQLKILQCSRKYHTWTPLFFFLQSNIWQNINRNNQDWVAELYSFQQQCAMMRKFKFSHSFVQKTYEHKTLFSLYTFTHYTKDTLSPLLNYLDMKL